MNDMTSAALVNELSAEIAVSPEPGGKGVAASAARMMDAIWESADIWAEEARLGL